LIVFILFVFLFKKSYFILRFSSTHKHYHKHQWKKNEKFCHNLLTLMYFQNYMTFFLLWDIKDIFLTIQWKSMVTKTDCLPTIFKIVFQRRQSQTGLKT